MRYFATPKKLPTGVVFEPICTFVYQKSRERSFLESSALDCSAILSFNLNCILPFGLFAVVLPFWKVQIRNFFDISFQIFGISFLKLIIDHRITNFVNAKKCSISRDASIWFLCSYRGRFWTQAHSGITKVSIESSQLGSLYRLKFSWVWRLRSLGHPAL